MTPLASLEARIAAATGPDREIDAALHVALVKPEQYPDDLRYFRLPHVSMDHMDMCAPGTYWLKQRSGASLHTAPTYSASLDAAIALCERVKPECAPAIGQNVHHGHWHARLSELDAEGGPLTLGEADAPTPALALCLALVRAIAAQEKQEE